MLLCTLLGGCAPQRQTWLSPAVLSTLFLPCRAALSVSQMNKLNMKATDARIQILKELAIVELDKQGNVKLVV